MGEMIKNAKLGGLIKDDLCQNSRFQNGQAIAAFVRYVQDSFQDYKPEDMSLYMLKKIMQDAEEAKEILLDARTFGVINSGMQDEDVQMINNHIRYLTRARRACAQELDRRENGGLAH